MQKGRNLLRTYILLLSGAIVALSLIYFIFFYGNPEIKITVKPDSGLKLRSDYPAFKSGILKFNVKGEDHQVPLIGYSEVVYKEIPAKILGEEIPVTLESDYWKLGMEKAVIGKKMELSIVPNSTLGSLYGNIIDEDGLPVGDTFVQIEGDTVLYTDNQGVFKADLSYTLQRENYHLSFSKNGFERIEANHIPGRNLVIHMKRSPRGKVYTTTRIVTEKPNIGEQVMLKAIDKARF